MRPLAGNMIHGLSWWLPSICYHQGGTMKTFAYIVTSSLVTLIVVGIFVLLRTAPQRLAGTESAPSTPFPHPTWTNTPVPIHTSTPSPTNTPIPTATLPPLPQDWNQLVSSAHRIPRDDLMRYHRDHLDKIVYFEGVAYQVLGDEDFLNVLLAVIEGEEFGGIVQLGYENVPIRVMKNDLIEVVGRFEGLNTYDSVGSGPITTPWINVIQLKIVDE